MVEIRINIIINKNRWKWLQRNNGWRITRRSKISRISEFSIESKHGYQNIKLSIKCEEKRYGR
jgi:hypothetical protein